MQEAYNKTDELEAYLSQEEYCGFGIAQPRNTEEQNFRKDRPGDVEGSVAVMPRNNFVFDERILGLYLPQKNLTKVVLRRVTLNFVLIGS